MRLESQLSRMNCQTFSTGLRLWALRRQQNDGDVGRHEEASANQISIVSRSSAFLCAIASRRAGKFF
jgi:hypothetical protein